MKTPGATFNMYIYILKCSDRSYYTGVTNNLERRLIEHHTGLNPTCYTFYRRPLELVYHQGFISIVKSLEIEKQVKKWSRKKKEALINGEWDLLIELSKKKFIKD